MSQFWLVPYYFFVQIAAQLWKSFNPLRKWCFERDFNMGVSLTLPEFFCISLLTFAFRICIGNGSCSTELSAMQSGKKCIFTGLCKFLHTLEFDWIWLLMYEKLRIQRFFYARYFEWDPRWISTSRQTLQVFANNIREIPSFQRLQFLISTRVLSEHPMSFLALVLLFICFWNGSPRRDGGFLPIVFNRWQKYKPLYWRARHRICELFFQHFICSFWSMMLFCRWTSWHFVFKRALWMLMQLRTFSTSKWANA